MYDTASREQVSSSLTKFKSTVSTLLRFVYPVTLEEADEGMLVSFADIPEALTSGTDRAEALSEAADCLLAALGGYILDRHPLPVASPARGRPVIPLPALVSAKLALYQTMLEQRVTNVGLARQLGTVEGTVRRLLDVDHRSHIGQVEAALAKLGRSLILEARPVRPHPGYQPITSAPAPS